MSNKKLTLDNVYKAKYALKDNRIEVIHKINGGLSDARNVGIGRAKGKYIGFVDSDVNTAYVSTL